MTRANVIASCGLLVLMLCSPASEAVAQASEAHSASPGTIGGPVRIEDLGIVLPQPKVIPAAPAKPQVETPPVLTKEEEKAEELARFGAWCGEPKDVEQCTDSIIYLDREIRRRVAAARKAGNPNNIGNLGLAIAGCPEYCRMRYFPSDSPQECKQAISTFKRMAKVKPYLLRSDFRETLTESCGKF